MKETMKSSGLCEMATKKEEPLQVWGLHLSDKLINEMDSNVKLNPVCAFKANKQCSVFFEYRNLVSGNIISLFLLFSHCTRQVSCFF